MSFGVARRWWPLAAGVVLGILVGLLVSLLGSGTRRAEASVLISSPSGIAAVKPMLPNLQQLAVSGVLAGNVRSTLRLSEPTSELRRHLHADVRPASEVIVIAATAGQADRARQVAQEAAVVFSQLVDAHFGTTEPELHAALLDSAHVLASADRHVLRNALAGALVGLLLAAAAMFVLGSRSQVVPVGVGVPDDADYEKRERVLEQRVLAVTARERALAGRAGKLASRERELDEREATQTREERELRARADDAAATKRELAERAGEVAAREKELEAAAGAPAPEPVQPEPVPEPSAPPAPAATAAWNLNELEKAVQARTNPSPEQAEEWRTYLFLLREHATQDGVLPRSFEPLIREVFAEVLHVRPSS